MRRLSVTGSTAKADGAAGPGAPRVRPPLPRPCGAACYDADVSAADPRLDPLPPAAPAAGQILDGPHFNEPMRIESAQTGANGTWNLGLVGLRSNRFRRVTLSAADLAALTARPPSPQAGWAPRPPYPFKVPRRFRARRVPAGCRRRCHPPPAWP